VKVFISYGHGDYTALVDAVFDALVEAGHQPWKDDRYEGMSGIPAGEDFTQVIYDAIRDSDFVLAFLTNKTVGKPYCRDERQYAYNHKGSKFIQLRLDGVEVRLGNAGSYIDMDACVDSTGKVNETCLQQKMQAVFAAFRSPDGKFSPDAKLERHLRVRGALAYDEFVTMPERDDFVGREWLKQTCIRWAQDQTIPCRLFVILGEAGTGKTAFIRHLAADKALVRSVHVCIYDRPVTRNVKDTLKDLAYTLTLTHTAYRDYLSQKDFEELDKLDYDGLFQFLFVDPLKDEKEKYLLIIDGLDELEETTGLRPLMQVLRQFADKINPNISILVTGRPEENIVSKIKTIQGDEMRQSVVLSRDNGQEDLYAYIEKNLEQLGAYSVDMRQKLYEACDGNFEYLSLLFKEAREEGLLLSESTALPRGLAERYTQYLDRRTERYNGEETFTKPQKQVVAVLSVAYEPISVAALALVTGQDEEDVENTLQMLGSLVRKDKAADGTVLVSFFSKGFRDYLLSEKSEKYTVGSHAGTKIFATYVLEHCATEADFERCDYIDTHGYAHLLLYIHTAWEEVKQYVNNMIETYGDLTLLRMINALCTGGVEVAVALFETGNGIQQKGALKNMLLARREMGVLAQVVEGYERTGDRWNANFLKANILAMDPRPSALKRAKLLYESAAVAAEEHVQEHPDSVGLLFSVYERIGDFCMAEGTKEGADEAVTWYKKMQALVKPKRGSHTDKHSREKRMILYNRFGDMAKNTGTEKGRREAAKWYKKMILLSEEVYAETPCYNTRRTLAVSVSRVADIERMKGTQRGREKAKALYLKAAALAEQNYKEMPCYHTRQMLSELYASMADVTFAAGKDDTFAEATAWCEKEIALLEQNYSETPCYESRKSLADAYQRMCGIKRKLKTPQGDVQAEIWQGKMLLLLMQNYGENPYYTARRDLAEGYRWIGSIHRENGTLEELRKAEEWYEKALDLRLESYREKKDYQRRHELSLLCLELGDNAVAFGTADGISKAAQWYEKALRISLINYAADRCQRSQTDLAFVWWKIQLLAKTMRKFHGFAAAKAWRKEMFSILTDGVYDALG